MAAPIAFFPVHHALDFSTISSSSEGIPPLLTQFSTSLRNNSHNNSNLHPAFASECGARIAAFGGILLTLTLLFCLVYFHLMALTYDFILSHFSKFCYLVSQVTLFLPQPFFLGLSLSWFPHVTADDFPTNLCPHEPLCY